MSAAGPGTPGSLLWQPRAPPVTLPRATATSGTTRSPSLGPSRPHAPPAIGSVPAARSLPVRGCPHPCPRCDRPCVAARQDRGCPVSPPAWTWRTYASGRRSPRATTALPSPWCAPGPAATSSPSPPTSAMRRRKVPRASRAISPASSRCSRESPGSAGPELCPAPIAAGCCSSFSFHPSASGSV